MKQIVFAIGRFLYDAIAALAWVVCEWEPMACKDSAAASSREKRKRQQTNKNI